MDKQFKKMDSPSYRPSWISCGTKIAEVTPAFAPRPKFCTNSLEQGGNREGMSVPLLCSVNVNGNQNVMHRDSSFGSSSSSSEDSVDAAILLTAMRSIASRELSVGSQGITPQATLSDLKVKFPHLDQLSMPILSSNGNSVGTAAQSCDSPPSFEHSFQGGSQDAPVTALPVLYHGYSSNYRMRAVSFDENNKTSAQQAGPSSTACNPLEDDMKCPPERSETPEVMHPPVVHSYVTPTGKRKKIDGPATIVIAPKHGKRSAPHKQTSGLKTILRRKFSWKNYPELEAFLVANREEYLRHSTLNYTVQQKQFNNRLTEQLIELAEQHGYVFDPTAFNFVTIRDRIRCYFKSYVQSSKKRGVIIGYAAKRAGLVTDRDLESSASTAGKIIIPT